MGLKERLLDQSTAIASVAQSDCEDLELLLAACEDTLRRGHQIVVSALGKNVPICEKFAGTLNSFGLSARFLHTNSAIHGDLGILAPGDLLVIVSKSGATNESVALARLVADRSLVTWALSCVRDTPLSRQTQHSAVTALEHEGDLWDLAPVNSSIVFLAVLNAIAVELSQRLDVPLQAFLRNHPGGAIGKKGEELVRLTNTE